MARAIALEYRGCRLSDDDLIGEAHAALVEAARAYSTEAKPGVPFPAFARVLIRTRVRDALYRAPVVHRSRDLERAAMRGELEPIRPIGVPVEELGVMPEDPEAPADDEAAVADALRHCSRDERALVRLMLRGCTVARAAREMGRPLHEARSLFEGARRKLAIRFAERGFPGFTVAGMAEAN